MSARRFSWVLVGFILLYHGALIADDCMACVSIRTMRREYPAKYFIGGKLFAKKRNLCCIALTSEGKSYKQIADIREMAVKTKGNIVFFVDANDAEVAGRVAEILEKEGVYWVSWWSKPDGVKVWNYKYWVSHISTDPQRAGEYVAEELIKSIGGRGKIIALDGIQGNSSSIWRSKGLHHVLEKYPDVEIVGSERADWGRGLAFEKVEKLLEMHPDVVGIWSANDNMALGALDYLRKNDLVGKIKVVGVDGISEMLEAIRDGEAVATVYSDAKYQAGIGLSLAYAAKNKKIDVEGLPRKYRQFFVAGLEVNKDNVEQVISEYVLNNPKYNYDNYFADFVRPME